MRNIRLTLEYDGTDFSGWQIQREGRTVQGVLEAALASMTRTPTRVRGAGRTDAGVHALGQVANFRTECHVPPVGFHRGLNAILPRDLAVLEAAEVDESFDARRHARGKRYTYRVWNHETRTPSEERTTWHVRAPLDVDAINAAAQPLLGEHDFRAFRAADQRESTVRLMRRIEAARRGSVVIIEVEATAFLKHMVRILVGTLVAAGRREITSDDVAVILASRDRTRAGLTAPPQGLCLSEVYY